MKIYFTALAAGMVVLLGAKMVTREFLADSLAAPFAQAAAFSAAWIVAWPWFRRHTPQASALRHAIIGVATAFAVAAIRVTLSL